MKPKPPAYTYQAKWNPEKKTFVGTCLELESVVCEAASLNEVIKRTKEAALVQLNTLKLNGVAVPIPLTERVSGATEKE